MPLRAYSQGDTVVPGGSGARRSAIEFFFSPEAMHFFSPHPYFWLIGRHTFIAQVLYEVLIIIISFYHTRTVKKVA